MKSAYEESLTDAAIKRIHDGKPIRKLGPEFFASRREKIKLRESRQDREDRLLDAIKTYLDTNGRANAKTISKIVGASYNKTVEMLNEHPELFISHRSFRNVEYSNK